MRKLLIVLTIAAMLGCGGENGKVTVSGIVKMDGQPLSNATIGFLTESGSSMASAATGADGRFRTDVAIGKNKVTVSKTDPSSMPAPPANEESTLSPNDNALAKMRSSINNSVPERFGDPNKSGLQYEIRSGMEPLDISITSK